MNILHVSGEYSLRVYTQNSIVVFTLYKKRYYYRPLEALVDLLHGRRPIQYWKWREVSEEKVIRERFEQYLPLRGKHVDYVNTG